MEKSSRNPLSLALLALTLLFGLLLAGPAQATAPSTNDDDAKPLKSGVTITGVIEQDYTDGLLLTTDEGVSYMVLTPEEVTLEQEEAFHKKFKGQTVSLTGNVYRDEDGSLSLFVNALPLQ